MISHDNPLTKGATRADSDLRGMFAGLERLGYDVAALAAPHGLSLADIRDPDVPLSPSVCTAVIVAAYEQRRHRNLTLRLAMESPFGAYPLADYVVYFSDTVGDAMRSMLRYQRLLKPAVLLELHEEPDAIRVAAHGPDRCSLEFLISLSVLRLKAECADARVVTRVCFRHRPNDVSEFESALECPVETDAAWDGWTIDRRTWDLPLRRSDPRLRKWLERKADAALEEDQRTTGFIDEVKRFLRAALVARESGVASIARRLSMSARTLQRRLTEEGTSFDALREEIRREMAQSLLADPRLSLAEVGYLLGYSEPAAFHRAFKRWHGITPQEFRSRQTATRVLAAPRA